MARPDSGSEEVYSPSAEPSRFAMSAKVLFRDRRLTTQIFDPTQSTDNAGSPDVSFRFTKIGSTAFQNVTATIAHRGAFDSGIAQTLFQHFAVALDTQLLSVPFIDFRQYADGIFTENTGAEITGNLTKQAARDLAIVLRYGPLPATLAAH